MSFMCSRSSYYNCNLLHFGIKFCVGAIFEACISWYHTMMHTEKCLQETREPGGSLGVSHGGLGRPKYEWTLPVPENARERAYFERIPKSSPSAMSFNVGNTFGTNSGSLDREANDLFLRSSIGRGNVCTASILIDCSTENFTKR
ncbi:Hypothetical Protein FCC1311_006011 [Hondaea fermentalgiana]|uniref:Uncharacterized protein n=1 Tax=Hondaea fermentalgiana TaxID=2315210 RepID=A0A2R5G8N3_9STRA|nr:Hypothetical Protein FCC1311_006011 [Hondaea fermentalgiana]|eukprot:GBG27412.1 Hypothetical Protein FCC1311_006011 [Hondaea fermentalgiana]